VACGFKYDDAEVRRAILEANKASVLVFAAASNYGNESYISFPARMQGNVICIFSSTGWIKQSEDFNPAPSGLSKHNFCVLGEEVEKFGDPTSTTKERCSGTSIATSIAAAIAALVIDLSRQSDCKEHIPNREDLQTVAGMSSIFQEMARGGDDNGYNCVAPWKVLECTGKTVDFWDATRKRKYISDRIFQILNEASKGRS
jgi:Subtilase family